MNCSSQGGGCRFARTDADELAPTDESEHSLIRLPQRAPQLVDVTLDGGRAEIDEQEAAAEPCGKVGTERPIAGKPGYSGRRRRYDRAVPAEAFAPATLETLSPGEIRALAEAAAWYAKYHERIIGEQADDRSALAVATRERFGELYDALAKLGVRLRRPDGLAA